MNDATVLRWRAALDAASVASVGDPVEVVVHLTNDGDAPVPLTLRWIGIERGSADGVSLMQVDAHTTVSLRYRLRLPVAGDASSRTVALEVSDPAGRRRLVPLEVRTGAGDAIAAWTTPTVVRGRFGGHGTVHVVNRSTRTQTVRVTAGIDGGRVRVDGGRHARRDGLRRVRGSATLPPGGTTTMAVRVQARPHLGRDDRHRLVQMSATGDGTTARATLAFAQAGLIPAASRKLAALVVLLGLWAGVLGGGVTANRHLRIIGGDGDRAASVPADLASAADQATADAATDPAGAAGSDGSGDANSNGKPTKPGVEISGRVQAAGRSAEGVLVRLRPVEISPDATSGAPARKPTGTSVAAAGAGPGDDARAGATPSKDPTGPYGTTATGADAGAGAGDAAVVESSAAAATASFAAAAPTIIRSPGDRSLAKRWSEAAASAPSALGDVRTTSTDVDGNWAFAGVAAPGVYELLFADAGFTSKSYVVTTADAAAPVQLDVELEAGDGALAGVVHGPGGPLGGVDVDVTDGVVTYHTTTATTGDVGAWSVEQVGTPARYAISFSRRGFGTETLAVDLATGASQTGLAATLVPGVGSIAGRVTADGQPLGNVTVTATNGTLTRSTTSLTSGAPGTFLLPQLPIPATYTLSLQRPGFVAQSLTIELADAASSARALDIAMISSTAIVSGTVRDSDGNGLAGVGIDVTDGTHVFKSTTTLTPPGTYELGGLPPGAYTVTFNRFEYEPTSSLLTVSAGERRTLDVPLARRPAVDIPQQAVLDGVVLSAADGQPLVGAIVTVLGTATAPVVVGTGGTFLFEDLPLGTYTVQIEGPSTPRHQTATRKVRLGTATTERLEVTLVPLGALTGHVTDTSGRSMEGVDVDVRTAGGTPVATASARTSSTGDYNMRSVLSTGSYVAVFSKAGQVTREVPFVAAVGETVRVDTQLLTQPRLSGQVLRPTGSTMTPFEGLGGAVVTAEGPGAITRSTVADTNGFYELGPTELSAGAWTVRVHAPGAGAYLDASFPVSLALDVDTRLDIALSPATSVTGTAHWTDVNGGVHPVAGLSIVARNAITGWQPIGGGQVAVRADLTGVATASTGWQLDGHVADAATYELSGTDVAPTTRIVTVQPGTPTPIQNVELQPLAGAITGVVLTDPAGQPDGHTVTLTAAGSALVLTTTTANGGAYRFDGLRPGTYQLTVTDEPDWIAAPAIPVVVAPTATTAAGTVQLDRYAALTVSVQDSAGPVPLNGATIELWSGDGTTRLASTVASGASATFDRLVLGSYDVRVARSGYAPTTIDDVPVGTHGATEAATATLTRWSVLRGTVQGTLAGADAPLDGALVTVQPTSGDPIVVSTGSDGTWQVGDLAGGDYTVTVTAAGYDDPAPPTAVTVVLGIDPAPLQATLVARLADLTMTVHTDANDTPIADLTVTASGTVAGVARTVRCTTDPAAVDDGAGLPACRLADGSSAAGSFWFDGFDATSVHLRLEARHHHPLEIDASLSPGSQVLPTMTLVGSNGSITGAVAWAPAAQAGTAQGNVEGATVVLTTTSAGGTVEVARTTTAGDGQFSFHALRKGRYAVTVSAGAAYSSAQDSTIDVDGQGVSAADPLVLVAQNRPVTVTVRSQPGDVAAAGAAVVLSGGPVGTPGISATDDDGDGIVTLTSVPPYVTPGYQLRVSLAGHPATTAALSVEPGTTARVVERALSRSATISRTVNADPTSANGSIRGVVEVSVSGGDLATPLTAVPNSTSGLVRFTDLPPGTYTVGYGAVSGFLAPADEVLTVGWGDAPAGPVTYTKLATVTVLLSGAGAGGRTVSVAPEAEGTTGPYPSGTVLSLRPGVDYTFTVAASTDHNGAASAGPVQFAAGATTNQSIVVPGEGTARLRLTDGAGGDLDASALATASVQETTLGAMGAVVTDGRLHIAGLPSGTYSFTVDGVPDRFAGTASVTISSGPAPVQAVALVAKGSISGTVVADEDGSAIAGASVCLDGGACQTTPAGGTYAYGGIDAGAHTLGAEALGSCPAITDGSFTVTTATAYQVTGRTLRLATRASFGVTVTVDGIAPTASMPVVTITVDGAAAASAQVVSHGDGTYTVTGVPSGTVTVEAASGGGAAETSFVVTPCETGITPVTLDVTTT